MSQSNDHSSASHAGQEKSPPSRARKRRHPILTFFLRIFQLIITVILIGLTTGAFLACYATMYIQTIIMPQTHAVLDALESYQYDENSVIYYYDEQDQAVELQTLVGEKNSEWVDFKDIPKDLIDATVAIEDRRFWTHHGVDWYRTAGAIFYMFTGQDIQGGSTITQQLIKNVTKNDDVTVKRKVLEIFTALEFEKRYDKDYILTWYLNEIYMGAGCNGIKTAAMKYFGKELSELTLAECASLISITNNPSMFSPYSTLRVTQKDGTVKTAVDYNKERQETVLYVMHDPEQGYITDREYREALAQELVFVDGTKQVTEDGETSTLYTWYVEAVIDEVFEDLREMDEYKNLSDDIISHLVYSGGLSIYTCFDPAVQAAVDAIYDDPESLDYTSSTGQKMLSAITVVDNSSGHVVAVGNTREKTVNRGWNDAVDGKRQPGSSFKPLASYSPAIDLGLVSMGSILDDNPTTLNGKVWPKNSPQGYDGLISLYTALAKSKNTISVQLLRMLTPEVSFEFLTEKYGFTTLAEMDGYTSSGSPITDIGMSNLALGGLQYGVTTYEMAAAYATFPRMGTYIEPTTYLAIYADEGKTLIRDNTPEKEFIIKESTAWYMNTMLTNAVRAGTGTSAQLKNMTAAGKTGTTNDNKDRWFAGYTPYYTAVVWTGYDTPEYMSVGSRNPAAVLWQKVMTQINESLALENASFPEYTNTVRKTICLDCGNLASGNCGLDPRGDRTSTFTYARGDEPTSSCSCHVTVEICRDAPILNAAGEPTGLYHKPNEFCPAESRSTIALVDYNRELASSGVSVGDSRYMISYYNGLAGVCTTHDWLTSLIPDIEWPWEEDPQPTNSGDPYPLPSPTDDPYPLPSPTDDPYPLPTPTEDPTPTPSQPLLPSEPDPTPSQPLLPSEPDPSNTGGGVWDYPWEQLP